jgi:hypothetical protein
MITMKPIERDGVRKFQLGELELALDVLPPDLRHRFDLICARIEKGDADLRGPITQLTRDVQAAMGPELLLRAAQTSRHSILDLGTDTAQRD